jgi:hypothetical protein
MMNQPSSDELYDRFVKSLEAQYQGDFVAVHPDGRLIVDKNDLDVVDRALKQFGPGNFTLLRIGSRGVGKWRPQRRL